MKNLQNTHHSNLIIYKSYATYVLSRTRGKWRLSQNSSITIGVDLVLICRKMWLHIVQPLAFRINHVYTLNVNIKSEAQQKKLKTVRGSYIDLDLSLHAKKGPEKSLDTLPLRYQLAVFFQVMGATRSDIKAAILSQLRLENYVIKFYTFKTQRNSQPIQKYSHNTSEFCEPSPVINLI